MMIAKQETITIFLAVAMFVAVFLAGCTRNATIDTELAEYVHEVIGIEVEDLCIEEFGEVKSGKGDEKTASICLIFEKGGLEKIRSRIEDAGMEPVDEIDMIFCDRENDPVSLKFKSETAVVKAEYLFLLDGFNGAKTRTVGVYLTTDNEGNECLYMFD